MPSLLPGYEYDIFVSYRHKDNKYDGWVSQFVSNLQKELEATFKEDISIYFDENPHDGLRETHDVDDSLKHKLKCVILIPIISQTYCDTKSFAWKNEFMAFKSLAGNDALGLKIKLQNGNVASRILPVKIHDLDNHDKAILENEIGPIRSIDFIFKSSGVNRPLTPDDARADNLNKTFYRDQINKTANGIKEIMTSLQSPSAEKPQLPEPTLQPSFKISVSIRSIVVALILLIGLTVAYFIFMAGKSEPNSASHSRLAIIPFQNNTGNPELIDYGIGMASGIRTQLSLSKQFDLLSSIQAALPYSETSKSISQIGNELSVNYILSGAYHQTGNKIKLEIQLYDAEKEMALLEIPFEGTIEEIFHSQTEIADKVLNYFSISSKQSAIRTTDNFEALAHYLRGTQLLESAYGDSTDSSIPYQSVIEQYENAIQLDSGFIDAWTDLIGVETFIFRGREHNDSTLEMKIRKYYSYFNAHFPDCWQKKLVQGHFAYRVLDDYSGGLKYFLAVLEENPENIHATYAVSSIYVRQLELDKALKYGIKQVLLSPGHAGHWLHLAGILSIMGDAKNTYKANLKAWSLSGSKDHAEGVIYSSIPANALDQLPEKLRQTQELDIKLWKSVLSNDWTEVKRIAKAKNDLEILSYACLENNERDSAIWYWKKNELKNKTGDSTRYFSLLGNREKAFDALHRSILKNSHSAEDKLMTVYNNIREIDLLIDFKEYNSANVKLTELNKNYPAFNQFNSFILGYERVKKESPALNETITKLQNNPREINLTNLNL